MKYFKKLNILLLSISLFLGYGLSTICYCGRHKENVDGRTFTFVNDSRTQERVAQLKLSLKHRKDENPGITPPVIAGGRYKSVPHAEKYESHHLISARFCRNHPDVILVQDAPSVLILKDIHNFTGSFGWNSAQYIKEEEEAYRTGGLQAVLELGIKDLNKVVNNHYATWKVIIEKPKFTPVKRAKAALQRIQPTAYPNEDLSDLISTPLKPKRAKL